MASCWPWLHPSQRRHRDGRSRAPRQSDCSRLPVHPPAAAPARNAHAIRSRPHGSPGRSCRHRGISTPAAFGSNRTLDGRSRNVRASSRTSLLALRASITSCCSSATLAPAALPSPPSFWFSRRSRLSAVRARLSEAMRALASVASRSGCALPSVWFRRFVSSSVELRNPAQFGRQRARFGHRRRQSRPKACSMCASVCADRAHVLVRQHVFDARQHFRRLPEDLRQALDGRFDAALARGYDRVLRALLQGLRAGRVRVLLQVDVEQAGEAEQAQLGERAAGDRRRGVDRR